VYLVTAAQAGLASLFEPARNALIPELVAARDVTGANGLMSVNNSVARLVGGWLGGVLLGLGGLGWVVAGYLTVLVVAAAIRLLGGSEADGLLRGVQAIGGLAAGLSVATIARKVVPEKLLGWGTLTLGVLSAVIWNGAFPTTTLAVYIGLFMAVGVPGVVAGAGLLAVIQAAAKPERAGRVLSTGFAGMAASLDLER
jgi:hypothetical protein